MSEKVLNPKTLDEETRTFLERLLSKDVLDLTVYDIGFIKARISYLTADQKDFFKDALDGTYKGIDYIEKATKKVEKVERIVKVDENGKKIIDPKDFDLKTLIQMCKDADLEFDEHANKQELADLLNKR